MTSNQKKQSALCDSLENPLNPASNQLLSLLQPTTKHQSLIVGKNTKKALFQNGGSEKKSESRGSIRFYNNKEFLIPETF